MNFKRIARMLICLVLVCCILVNISPIKAEALVFDTLAVGAGMFALSCMIGLGVGFQTYELAEPYITDCVEYLKSIDYVDTMEQISIYSAGAQQYYASQEMVEAVRDWIFSKEIVKETPITDSSLWVENLTISYNGKEYVFSDGLFFPVPIAYRYIYTDSSGIIRYYWYNQILSDSFRCDLNGKYSC